MVLNRWLTSLLLVSAAFCLGALGWMALSVNRGFTKTLAGLDATVEQARQTASTVNQYTAAQARVFNSKENRDMEKALRLSAATIIKILRKVDQHTLPTLNADIEAMKGPIDGINTGINSLRDLVQHTDSSLNDKEAGIIPVLSATVVKSQAVLQDIDELIKSLSEKSGIDLTDIHNILADPSWKDSQKEVLDLVRHINAIATNVEKASDAAPQIAKDLESISKKSNRFATPLLIARIASLLAWMIPSLQ